MKSPAKKIITSLILGTVLFNAGLLFAKDSENICNDNEIKTYASEEDERRREEFWNKFRESVTPREKEPPKEVHPRETPPKEVHPEEE